MSARLDTSIGDIADKFNYTEKDVIRALKYWEKNRLLLLDYDDRKNIVGIHLMDSGAPSVNMSAKAPSVGMTTYPSAEMAAYPCAAPTAPTLALVVEPALPAVPEKPNYTAAQLQTFKADENISRLLFVAEQYLKNRFPSAICGQFFLLWTSWAFPRI